MKKIIRERGMGKTTELIKLSAETGAVIVTPFTNQQLIMEKAIKMNLDIPQPINLKQLMSDNCRGKNFDILLDDAEYILKQLFDRKIIGISMAKPKEITMEMIRDKFGLFSYDDFEVVN